MSPSHGQRQFRKNIINLFFFHFVILLKIYSSVFGVGWLSQKILLSESSSRNEIEK